MTAYKGLMTIEVILYVLNVTIHVLLVNGEQEKIVLDAYLVDRFNKNNAYVILVPMMMVQILSVLYATIVV